MTEKTPTITEWSVDGLLDEIRHLNNNMKDRALAFILGAGASISSGIPAGGALAKKWLEEIYLRENLNTGEKIEIWASKQLDIDEFQLHDAATYYAKIFELRFGCDPQSGYAALEAVMEEAEPSVGYAILAKILDKTRNKVVITTNFDNLVADALALQALRAPLIVGHESLTGFINPRLSRPLVAKIHRDLHLHPKNDQNGVQCLEQGWQEALSKLFQNYTPVIIGYGGNDESLMGFLSNLPHKHIPGRLFWCYREGDYPQQRIIDVVSHHQGVLVAIAGFDEFMVQLAQALFPGFMLDSIAKEIEDIGNERAKKYETLANKLIENVAKQNIGPSSVITQQAQQSISEAGNTEDESKWWQWELRAKLAVDPTNKKAIYEKGIQKLQKSSELHGNYANFLADQCKDYDTAETMYKRAIELDPNNAHNYGNYATLLVEQRGDYDTAETMYKRALELDPSNADHIGNYANFLADQRESHDLAETMYKRALELNPHHANNTGNYANFLADQREDYDTAEVMYKKSLELAPNSSNHIGNYAHFLATQRGDYDAAEAMYKRALELAPHDANNTGNYASFLADQRGDYDAAEAMYKRALELDPHHANNTDNYASFLADQRENYDAAEAMYKRAIELDPNNANYINNYAHFLATQRGDYDAAEAMYTRAIELDPNDIDNIANYTSLLLIRNKPEDMLQANVMVQRAVAISQKTPSQGLAEVLFYHCLLEELNYKTPSRSIGRLKMLFELNYKRGTWDFSPLFNSCLPKIELERHDFYLALAAAILDKDKLPALDNFTWWNDATKEDPFTLTA
ncbi:tetratricopeptide repeat protein [Aeromonas veronii]|nr:tetratricopeptide repeat protein [Aeromonas veronii]